MAIQTFRDLEVYQESYQCAMMVSKLTRTFPQFEQVEIARQLRRSARSIPANIAEGWAKRNSASEFKRFLQMAIGSCHETHVWLDMSFDEGYFSKDKHHELTARYNHIGIMLHKLWKTWRVLAQAPREASTPQELLTS